MIRGRRGTPGAAAACRAFAPDVIVGHPKSIAAPHTAEALECPFILASPLPGFAPTASFPTPLLPFASLGPFNRVSHALAVHGPAQLFGEWREQAIARGLMAPGCEVLLARPGSRGS